MVRSTPQDVTVRQITIELTLTVYPSATVAPRQPFDLMGSFIEYRDGFPRALPNRTVTLYRQGVAIATTVTDNGGAYYFRGRIEPDPGTFSYYTKADSVQSNTVMMTVTTTQVPTNITINVDKTTLTAGENATITGVLTDTYGYAVSDQYVNLLVNGAVTGFRGLTDQFGAFTIIWPLGIYGPGTYTLNNNFGGAGMLAPSTSSAVSVTIQKSATQITLGVDPTDGFAPLTIVASGRLTRVSDGAGLYNKPISLLVDGVGVTSGTTDSGGYYSLSAIILNPGTYTIETDFAGDADYLGC